ncbi:P-loop containing nucleoside triphosphate hydrolase protein [Amanita rubescens]|nr:P-loop containing nucleoside triphosphate hydrolase protein [Amanita rubescens]
MASLPPDSYLNSLNIAQLRAVEHPPHVPLQILAGPGSGKTKVLTSRIAHLILRHSIPPSSICAVTFTNKAANEMRERLKKILGKNRVGEVKMGTFHALCAQFLRRYAHTIALSDNFSICDADESKRIIKQLLKKYAKMLAARNMTVKEGVIMSKISQAKAKSVTAEGFAADVEDKLRERGRTSFEEMYPPEIIEKIAAETYIEYERLLRLNNSLDFDDLLLFGVKMFKAHRNAVNWCQHVLVDEFQDTNIIQYDLMRTIAHRNCVTIVGDPDQSIYGWRSAEVENLANMKRDFPGTQEIHLEENYRSTGAILRLSLGIISEDKKRIQKSLHTSHPLGKLPTLRSCATEVDESSFIADEIKRVIAYMGGLLQFSDFAILLRFNALSRVIERALQKEGIPCQILGGHRFFERLEVKDLLAYLQLVDNPQFYPAFARAVNVPSRGVGEKTLLEIASKAEISGVSHLEVLERIYDGKIPDIKPPVKRKINSFVNTIRTLRDLAQKRTSPADLLRHLLLLIDYAEHLKKTQTDWESRWANVEELINFATEVGLDAEDLARRNVPTERDVGSRDTPLRLFVQASSLSSEGDNKSDATTSAESKVTIATCHAAKGLEWPVVMIPSVEQGTFPLSRSEDIEEERRLLYVACTRAQGLLYLTHAQRRNVAGRTVDTSRSHFVESVFIKNPVWLISILCCSI